MFSIDITYQYDTIWSGYIYKERKEAILLYVG
jgi:hypothetical protein